MKRIFLFGCIIAATNSFAQSDTTRVIDSFYTLSPVEVKATRVSEKAPFAVSNITQKDIQKQNLGQSLPYLLNQTPSLVLSSDDGAGVGYSSMRIRGTDITRINVTFNGIPVNDAESQGTFFVDIPDLASSTNSIQIQRGVGSSTNGAGAFGASVNISNIEQSKVATATISNAYGSFDTWKHTLRASTGILKGGFQFDTRLSKISSNGYVDRAFSDLKSLQFLAGWTSANETTNIKFNLLTGKERTGQAWNGIEVSYDKTNPNGFNYSKELDKIGRTTNNLGYIAEGKYYDDQSDNFQQDYYQLFINQKFAPNWTANLTGFMTRGKGFYNEYKNGWSGEGESFSDYGLPASVEIGNQTFTSTALTRQLWLNNYYYGSVFSTNYVQNKTNLTFGGAITKYDGKHYGFVKWAERVIPLDYKWYDLTAFKNDFNVFGKIQQEFIDGLFAFVDLQYRHVAHTINGFRKNPDFRTTNDFSFFNPKAGLSYLIKHDYNGASKIYGSFAIANREPNRDDFEASQTSLPKPENLKDFEAGYLFGNSVINTGVNGFYMHYKNQIVNTGKINDVGAYERTNVDNSYRAGVELFADAKPLAWLQLGANATLSKNKIKSLTQYSDGETPETFTNTDIALTPNTIVGGNITFNPLYNSQSRQHFYIDLLGKHIGRQYLDNSSNKLKSINPYTLFDTRLRYTVTSKPIKEIGFVLMVNNLLNKKYENNGYTYEYDGTVYNAYFPQAGTNWNVGLNFSF